MSSTIKLLPCPFCNNAEIAIKNENPKDNSGGYFIECPGCGASTSLRFACGDDPTHLLAEQWNCRATVHCLHQIQEPVADIWPCVNIDVDESGNITNAKLYSPGLPAGNHDVYPVRVPYMDEHTEAWLACVAELRKHLPEFMHLRDMNGIECAVAAIRELAERPAPVQASDRDAAFEAVRQKFCKLQRYSFFLDDKGNVRRTPDYCGNWVEFEAVHTLFEPAAVEAALATLAALAAQGSEHAD